MPTSSKTPSNDRINKILQEIRIVLPGTQALLGFQFVAFFNAAFKTLPPHLQLYHLVNLLLVTCSTILLITPVGFQEIRERGRNTERFIRFTSRVITIAMFFLLIGMTGDVFVAGYLLQEQVPLVPALAAGLVGTFGFVMWFGLIMYKRR